jgi:hypothetical protein
VPTEKPKAIALGFSVGTMLWGETSVQVAGNFFVFALLGQLDADTEHREVRRGSNPLHCTNEIRRWRKKSTFGG